MNRRLFLTGAASVTTMGKSKLPLGGIKTVSSISGNFRPYIIEQSQVLHIYSFLGKSLPGSYVDIDNVDVLKLKKFQAGLFNILPISDIHSLGTIESMEHLEYWIGDIYMREFNKKEKGYGEWLKGIPKNLKDSITGEDGNGFNIVFNEDALVDHVFCTTEGIEPELQESLFSYLRAGGKVKKGDIDIKFSFDSRDNLEKWRYKIIDNSIQQGTHEISLRDPSKLSEVLEMPETELRKIMDRSEKIDLKEEEISDINNKEDKIEIKNKKATTFQAFLLGSTSMTDIKNYTGDQVQEILDYLIEPKELGKK